MSGYQPKRDGDYYWCVRGMPPWVACHRWEGDRFDQLMRDTGRSFETEAEARQYLAEVSPPSVSNP